MRAVPHRPLVLLVGAVALLGGCGTGGGATLPGRGPGLPARPAAIDVLRIDPCSMLDDGQQAGFSVTRESSGRSTVNGVPTDGCAWLASDGWGYNAQTFPIGAETAFTDPTAVRTSVAGFGAVQTWFTTSGAAAPPICLLTIDTTPGAAIRVQARPGPGRRPDPDAERPAICDRAQRLGEAVMATVLAPGR